MLTFAQRLIIIISLYDRSESVDKIKIPAGAGDVLELSVN